MRRVDGHVTFLGRVFYGAGAGELGSIQDPLRTWRKLHLSFAPPHVSDGQALANRAVGYLTLDPGAPVVSDWCRKVLRFVHEQGEIDRDSPYFAWLSNVHPEMDGWPQLARERAYDAISWRENIPVDDVRQLVYRIGKANSLSELGNLYNNDGPVEVTNAVDVMGTVLYPLTPSGSVSTLPVTRRPRGDAKQRPPRPPVTSRRAQFRR